MLPLLLLLLQLAYRLAGLIQPLPRALLRE
jgi:hypothetical protein